ncbi:alkaline phosphatase D family protein [Planctomycetes bacterium K23_9]|uniref:PhoD-like phosphatase n=1 Tax=Stieleria marina TaxID=1930275 RepID=A0A517NTC7_9BACT|nr:PhoD-like phosphatase [Planctomycetes bacterium K23_9]
MSSLTRRFALKLIGFGSACLGLNQESQGQETAAPKKAKSTIAEPTVNWSNTHDRVFLGGECWANPMESWRISDGSAECLSTGADRNVHLLTHQLTDPTESFEMSVVVDQMEVKKQDLGAGFKIGVKSELNELRSNAFAKSGIKAGVVDGTLILANRSLPFDWLASPQSVTLKLTGKPADGKVELTLTATTPSNDRVAAITAKVPADAVLGNVAVVNNFVPTGRKKVEGKKKGSFSKFGGARYRFTDWSVSGKAFTITPENRFGPLLWTMYSLSDSRSEEGFVMKLSALTGPMGENDNKDVELWIEKDGDWKSLGTAPLHQDAWTATFRIANWDETSKTPYKVVYREKQRDGSEAESVWTGSIKANPSGRPLRLGALTCQNDYGFPYAPVAENLIKLDPDMLYFSGDQIYESHGGFGIIRSPAEPAILNYLRKFYQHGWSFRHAMKDAPTICLADDHDVFQGNVWGEGGAPMDVESGGTSSNGGYIEPARMVNTVHITNCAHHPDFYDATPVQQDISVYYGDMVYGDVSFAIIADRQWKSGPQNVETGSGRADHVKDQDVDTAFLDKPGLVLLGERQESFLRHWVDDWRGHKMKVLLSQTVFAGVATHHGAYNGYLKADLDSGAWPKTARNNAIKIIRKGMPLHINGDQHLTTLSQYGVDAQRDSCWSFCTPAISAGYPRWWRPDEMNMPHKNRPDHGRANTGEYLDGFGNKIYVYAVGNPDVGTEKNRYDKAHQKGSGFGLVTIDTKEKTYHMDSFRFKVDALDGNPENQFPGWPVTIHQKENAGQNQLS